MRTNKLALIFLTLVLSACGTTTGNGRITVSSASFATAGVLGAFARFSSTVTDFKICVKQIQLKNDQDEIRKKNDQDDIDFPVGLIDLSAGSETSWGNVDVPVNFTLKRVKIQVHKDRDLCGVDYSVKYNSFSSNQNLVIKYAFDPAIDLKAGDSIELSMSTVVNALKSAVDGGSLSNHNLKDKIEDAEGSARRR